MTTYQNVNGNSGVIGYEIGSDYIDVEFEKTPKIYRYSYQSAGRENVEHMKVLAKNGEGLNTFINKYVRLLYVK